MEAIMACHLSGKKRLDKQLMDLEKKATQILKRKDTQGVGLGHKLVTISERPFVRITVKPGEEHAMILEALMERLHPSIGRVFV